VTRGVAVSRADAQDPTRVVITRAQIEAGGWFNLGEILTGATGWHRITLDGVSFFASADGFPPGAVAPSEPEWLVLIDGQRVGLDALGAKLLEMLPLSLAQTESVTVTRGPRLVAGTIAGRGVIEFHTRQTPRGPSLTAAWHSGNVIGDPGPYAFTPLATQNVDRLGPYDHSLVGFGGARWDVSIGAREGSSHITHRGIRERFDPVLYEQLGEHKWAPYDALNARLGAALFGARHDVIAGRGWVNGPLFFPLAGSEQWLQGMGEHVGASGSIAPGRTAVTYQLTHSSLDVRELASPFPFVVGHSRRRTAGVLELAIADGRGRRARLGASASRWSVERNSVSADRVDATLLANLTGATGRASHELSGALGRSSGGPIVGKGVIASRITIDSLTTVFAVLGYVQHATGDDGTWIDRALLGFDTLARDRGARSSADIGASRKIGGGLIADVAARVSVVSDVRLLAPSGLPVGSPSEGGLAEARVSLSRPFTARVPVARIGYRYVTPASGDPAVRAALRATAVHVVDASLVSAVARDLRLGTFVHVASRTHWSALRGGPPTPISLPAVLRLDVSAEKWFWRHRVRTQLLVRNLLNRSERYHPLGAEFPLRAHLTVALALPPT
jgi:hypothetical protein